MIEVLEDAGIEPHLTPVDHLPLHAAWALASSFKEQNGESYDE